MRNFFSISDKVRTCDLFIRSELLFQLSYGYMLRKAEVSIPIPVKVPLVFKTRSSASLSNFPKKKEKLRVFQGLRVNSFFKFDQGYCYTRG